MTWTIYMDDRKVLLPSDLSLSERINLCQKIIDDNYDYFDYQIPTNKCAQIDYSEKVMIRLSVMGDYIYAASPSPERNTITKHAEKQILKHEVSYETL